MFADNDSFDGDDEDDLRSMGSMTMTLKTLRVNSKVQSQLNYFGQSTYLQTQKKLSTMKDLQS